MIDYLVKNINLVNQRFKTEFLQLFKKEIIGN